jgi:hypothetical protein
MAYPNGIQFSPAGKNSDEAGNNSSVSRAVSSASDVMWAWLADVYITSRNWCKHPIIRPAVVQRVWVEQGPNKQNRRDVSSLQKWL